MAKRHVGGEPISRYTPKLNDGNTSLITTSTNPVHLYHRADVVKAYYFYKNAEGKIEGTDRPVIIKDLLKNSNYLVVKISRSNKKEDLLRVRVNSKEWREMGLYDLQHDSFVDTHATLEIREDHIREKLGTCPITLFVQL